MQLENNNIKVLKIFFNFLQKNQGKFLKNLEKFQKIQKFLENIEKYFRKFSKFLQNLENIYLKKLKIRKHQQLNCFELNKYIIV